MSLESVAIDTVIALHSNALIIIIIILEDRGSLYPMT